MILETLNIRKRRIFLKICYRLLRYWQGSLFVPVVTLVLINHPNYLCYLGLCFSRACFKCATVLPSVVLQGRVGWAAGECFPCLKSSLVFSRTGQALWYSIVFTVVELLCLYKWKACDCFILKEGRWPFLQVFVLQCFSMPHTLLLGVYHGG